jgi:hypothetical protein
VPGDPSWHVHHRDSNPTNCAFSNPRWVTSAQNKELSRRRCRWTPHPHARNHVKLTEAQVLEIRRQGAVGHSGTALGHLAVAYGFRGIRSGRSFSAGTGSTWQESPLCVYLVAGQRPSRDSRAESAPVRPRRRSFPTRTPDCSALGTEFSCSRLSKALKPSCEIGWRFLKTATIGRSPDSSRVNRCRHPGQIETI